MKSGASLRRCRPLTLHSCYQTSLCTALGYLSRSIFFPSRTEKNSGLLPHLSSWIWGWGGGRGTGSESWGAAHKCNWSLGIFTWGLINMPLKHSRHICPTEQRQRQIMMIRTFFFLLWISTSSWRTRYWDVLDVWLWCELIKHSFPAIFKRPDRIKTETVVLGLTKGTIKI